MNETDREKSEGAYSQQNNVSQFRVFMAVRVTNSQTVYLCYLIIKKRVNNNRCIFLSIDWQDIQLTASRDEHYFVFEDLIYQVR